MLIVIKMPWTPTYSPGSSIGSQNHVTPPTGGNYGGFNSSYSGAVYQVSGYSDAMYERVADDASGNHIWEFHITRRTYDNGWLHPDNTPNHGIRWTGTQWEDHDTTGNNNNPTSVTLNGSTVELRSGSTVIGTFTHPYSSSSSSVSTLAGAFSKTVSNGIDVYHWTIYAASDTASNANGWYYISRDGVDVQGPLAHTHGQGAEGHLNVTTPTLQAAVNGLYQLYHQDSNTKTILDAVRVGKKRSVKCNFW